MIKTGSVNNTLRRVGKSSDAWQKSGTMLFKSDTGIFRIYSQLVLQRKPLGPALNVRLIESEIKGVKECRDRQLHGVRFTEVSFL